MINFSNWDSKDNNKSTYDNINYKMNRQEKNARYHKLRMLLLLKSVHGVLYVKCKLYMIKLAKEIFILDLEYHNKVFINAELQNRNYPLSMRFYDFIINYSLYTIGDLQFDKFKFLTNF